MAVLQSTRRRVGGRRAVGGAVLGAALVAMIGFSSMRGQATTEPQLTESAAALDTALSCPTGFASQAHDPVLLVHGTDSTPEENWGWNLARTLPALGFATCTVRLPGRATGDLQRSSEYIVAAIRSMNTTAGRPIDVVGHSQGGLVARWALRWWPSLRTQVDDVVALGAPGNGVQGLDRLLGNPVCTPACYQMLPGSMFLAALRRPEVTPDPVSYTSISSQNDQIIQPVFVGEGNGGVSGRRREILVQGICPGRTVGHIEMVSDAAVFATAIDALTNPGPADPARIDRGVCAQILAPGTDLLGKLQLDVDRFLRTLSTKPPVNLSSEPPLAPYVTAG